MADPTDRERQVLRRLGLGWSNKDIAHGLDISVCTVKSHVSGILRDGKFSNRFAAGMWAHRHQSLILDITMLIPLDVVSPHADKAA